MDSSEQTKPRRSDIFPPSEAFEDSGPGCTVWGIVGIAGLALAVAIVITAGFAGFSQGLNTAHTTATAEREANILRQCAQLPDDIAAGRIILIQSRFIDIAQDGILPACAQPFVADATRIYLESMATPTAAPTIAPSPTDVIPEILATEEPTSESTSSSGYDLPALLQEARDEIAAGDYAEAIRTLDAVRAIDTEFQPSTINGLLFNALTARATLLYRGDGSLAEAIQLTNRAEEYGDVGDLNFERSVAQYYLDAQAFLNVNYPAAIEQLNLVRSFASNYRNTNTLLVQQYTGYGDAFVLGSEPCRAVPQYDAALLLSAQPAIQTKRDQAAAACAGAVTPVGTPGASATTIAPVGQTGS